MFQKNRRPFIFLLVVLFFTLYTYFWINFFNNSQDIPDSKIANRKLPVNDSDKQIEVSEAQVLSAEIITTPTSAFPDSYKIAIPSRVQFFNLSCEFAAASTALYYATNNESFSPKNEEYAEKLLISQIGPSQNPNLGIRIGTELPNDADEIYKNLNQRFGGTDYYGIHAPPFIELFEKYGLSAQPIDTNNSLDGIKKAVSSGHLIMAWIRIGQGQPIDFALSYGTVPLIRGEHTIVINGYDQGGVFVMDPGTGRERHINYSDLLSSSSYFPIPFLEVYKSVGKTFFSLATILPFDRTIGLNRDLLKVGVVNASGKTGEGSSLAEILLAFGYKVTLLSSSKDLELEDLSISVKKEKKDYLYLLKKDLRLSFRIISSINEDLPSDSEFDLIITVGR